MTEKQIQLLNKMVLNAQNGSFQCLAQESDFDPELKTLYRNIRQLVEARQNDGFEMQASASQIMSSAEDLHSALTENAAFFNALHDSSECIL